VPLITWLLDVFLPAYLVALSSFSHTSREFDLGIYDCQQKPFPPEASKARKQAFKNKASPQVFHHLFLYLYTNRIYLKPELHARTKNTCAETTTKCLSTDTTRNSWHLSTAPTSCMMNQYPNMYNGQE
jgi:hypothetical protein